MNNIPRPEHPLPQWERESWINLNGKWEFDFDFGRSARDRKLYADEAGRRAVSAAVQRESRGGGAECGRFPNSYRAVYPLEGEPLISVVIPNRDSVGLLRPCIDSLYATKEGQRIG